MCSRGTFKQSLVGTEVDLLWIKFFALIGSSEIGASVTLEQSILILFKTILVVVCLNC